MLDYISICAIFIALVILYMVRKYNTEGLDIVYYGESHNISKNLDGSYNCGDKKCDDRTIYLFNRTAEPTRTCYAQKINGK